MIWYDDGDDPDDVFDKNDDYGCDFDDDHYDHDHDHGDDNDDDNSCYYSCQNFWNILAFYLTRSSNRHYS